MKKIKILLIEGGLRFGGVEKSSIEFMRKISTCADVDLLLWKNRERELETPMEVREITVPTVNSVRYAIKTYGLLSRWTILSILASFCKKRWKVMPKLKKEYDVAIAFSHAGFDKYYVIDKVNAKKKFTFYHNGAYTFSDDIRRLDKEYYPKYDKIFAVSEHIKDLLHNEISSQLNIEVLHNLVDINGIIENGKAPCKVMDAYEGLKIVTVGRLSAEKNPLKIIEVCKELKKEKIDFRWYVIGDGPLKNDMIKNIEDAKLHEYCILCGSQKNPYCFMSRADIYVQLSKYEAEPITIQEVAIFGVPMVLSKIDGFSRYANIFNNITLVDDEPLKIAQAIISDNNKRAYHIDKIKELQSIEEEKINNIILN